jgi:hypothetical protein
MITRRTFGRGVATLLGAGALLALSACGDDRWSDYNYKMTVWVGGKAFSSVRHVEVTEGASIQDSSGRRVDRKTIGEAVIIETPGGPVFALLTPEEGQFGNGFYGAYVAEPALVPAIGKPPASETDLAVREYEQEQPGYDWLAGHADRHNAMLEVKGPRELPRTIPNPDRYRGNRTIAVWPMLVRFGDPADPRTVRKVSPEAIGVTRITIEVTDEDMTTGIEERLGWLPKYFAERQRLSGNHSIAISNIDHSLAESLGVGDFWIGASE